MVPEGEGDRKPGRFPEQGVSPTPARPGFDLGAKTATAVTGAGLVVGEWGAVMNKPLSPPWVTGNDRSFTI